MKLRSAIQSFAEAMERELRKNDHKTDDFEGPEEIVARTVEELGELLYVIATPGTRSPIDQSKLIVSEAADVANFLCMLVLYFHPIWSGINDMGDNDE